MHYLVQPDLDGRMHRVSCETVSRRRIAEDDEPADAAEGSGFRVAPGAKRWRHTATIACHRCSKVYSRAQTVPEGSWRPRTERMAV